MGNLDFFNNIVDNKILDVRTAYLAEVLSTDGNTAKIQPLGTIKQYGQEAQAQSPLTNVTITQNGRYKIRLFAGEIDVSLIQSGDIAVCICLDRDSSAAKRGQNETPTNRHHSMSDSIIIGVL